ncbi:FABP5 [Lepeophtheirus salmonis]|uniref:FABP5 n=1 Tax=Lepeophtheirus salmonis TaxID=72036 RepID=A0A7R8H0E0_LEPSM|nr:FABP5 [Lepeophtheirus salmonis]CAF2789893.1 FABP5 [Lepeophtheirus salmonis]
MIAFLGEIQPNILRKIQAPVIFYFLVSTPSFKGVVKEGEVRSFKTSTVAKSMKLKFKVGKKFEETTSEGHTVEKLPRKGGKKSTKTVCDFKDGNCASITQVMWLNALKSLK